MRHKKSIVAEMIAHWFHAFDIWSKLQRRADPTAGEWANDEWLELNDRTGQPAGQIHARFG